MAKKITAKQRREERERQNKQKWAKRQDEATVVFECEADIKPADSKDEDCTNISIKREKKKTQAKAMGLKTVLGFDNKIAIASFTSSKDSKSSHIERITDPNGETIREDVRMFDSNVDECSINLEKRMTVEERQKDGTIKKDEKDVKSTICNPYSNECGKDYIGIKSVAEELFFGRTFSNDNLRVQIAYNIFDIQKILGTYVNNIIYSFYNLSRDESQSDNDVIGTLYALKDFDGQKETDTFRQAKALLERTEAYYSYFDNVFKKIDKKKKRNDDYEGERNEILRYNFNVLRVLSFLRQICAHAKVKVSSDNDREKGGVFVDSLDALFNISSFFDAVAPELNDVINSVYSKGIDKVNNDFVENGKNNFYILSKIYPEVAKEDLLKEYYYFVVSKEGNNIGISTKKLKEAIIAQDMSYIKSEDYDTYRNKLYTVLCFILVKELNERTTIREQMVADLRANMKGDIGREEIYSKYAKIIYAQVKPRFDAMKYVFEEEAKGVIVPDKEEPVKFSNGVLDKSEIKHFRITSDDTVSVAKIVYFLCKFLDGKEINELCCAMINKLDGINDLIETAKQCVAKIEFIDKFSAFSNCATISSQIRVVKSISKMKKEIDVDNETVFLDAFELLGKRIEKYKKDDSGNVLRNDDGKVLRTKEYNDIRKMLCKKDRRLNFIANSIIKSKWFSYIVRYNQPSECQAIMKNKTLVKFALDELPNLQIQRYFASLYGNENLPSCGEMRKILLKKLHDFSIRDFDEEIGSLFDEMKRKDKFCESDRKKSLFRLYLTIAYLITKSMVKINTRFSIACATYERDYALLCASNKQERAWSSGATALALTRKFLNQDKLIFEKHYAREGEISKLPKEERKAMRKVNDQLLKQTHFSKHSYCYIIDNVNRLTGGECRTDKRVLPVLNEKNDNAGILLDFRKTIAHLNVVHKMVDYVDKIKGIKSYYAFFCYVLQRMLIGNNLNEKNALKEKYSATVKSFGTYSKDFMWLINLPFAYNLPRYKNLSNEQLFYDEEERNETEEQIDRL